MKETKDIIVIPLILLLLFSSIIDAGAQGIDINAANRKGLYLGLSLSPLKTSIINSGSGSVAVIESSPATSVASGIEIGYSISSNLSISSGVGFMIYNSSFDLGTYTSSYDTTDSENEAYKRYIDGSGISETQKITFLSIPVSFNISIPLTDKFGFYVRPGLNMLFQMNSAFDNSGTFDYSGYYTKYNVTISDVPFEGFKAGAHNTGGGELIISPLNFEFCAGAGAELSLQKKLKLTLGVEYRKIITGISDYEVPASFRLSTKPDQMNSVMAGCNDVSAKAFGVSVGLRYYME